MFNNRTFLVGGVILLGFIIWVSLPKNSKDFVSKNSGKMVESVVEGEPGSHQTKGQPKDENVQQLYENALVLRKDRNFSQAKEIFQKILSEHPDFEQVEKIVRELESLNMEVIFSNTNSDQSVLHEVVLGDTLGKLAKKYHTTIDLIKIKNKLKSNVIRIGQKLRVWNTDFNIYVDKSQNILLLKEGDEVVKVYDVSTGEDSSTPVGSFIITTRLTDPVWFNRGVMVPPESPQNVLGSRWLGFNAPGYGIHGTVEPETIGQPVTAGCVRMRNNEVEELYNMIPNGTKVVIVD